jgi:hypothetical protein
MSKLDPRIEAIRDKYDLAATDFWELPQKKGTWVAKHAALEIVAVKANIVWSMPQIVEANGADGIAAMIVAGTMGDRTEWATGEASPKNNKNAYPWAMAEKRAKDRVVLKLSGIGGLVYSEDEADDFKQPEQRTTDQRSEAGRREVENQGRAERHRQTIIKAKTLEQLQDAFLIAKADKSLTKQEAEDLIAAKDARKAELTKPDVPPNFDALDKDIPFGGERSPAEYLRA